MNETKVARLTWRTSVLWVVAGLVGGFVGLKLAPKSLGVPRWWVESHTGVPNDLIQGFFATVACCFLASTFVLSVGNVFFPRSGTRPVIVSLFVTAAVFLLILALVSLAVSDLMGWI
jgi:hypothetical protein